jgi:hypothetical protein
MPVSLRPVVDAWGRAIAAVAAIYLCTLLVTFAAFGSSLDRPGSLQGHTVIGAMFAVAWALAVGWFGIGPPPRRLPFFGVAVALAFPIVATVIAYIALERNARRFDVYAVAGTFGQQPSPHAAQRAILALVLTPFAVLLCSGLRRSPFVVGTALTAIGWCALSLVLTGNGSYG